MRKFVETLAGVDANEVVVLELTGAACGNDLIADGDGAIGVGSLRGAGNAEGECGKGDCRAAYPSAVPAKSWLDDDCSYASNEIAINWNAPLVYVSGAIQALTPPPMSSAGGLSKK